MIAVGVSEGFVDSNLALKLRCQLLHLRWEVLRQNLNVILSIVLHSNIQWGSIPITSKVPVPTEVNKEFQDIRVIALTKPSTRASVGKVVIMLKIVRRIVHRCHTILISLVWILWIEQGEKVG